MNYFRRLWSDTRQILSTNTDLLVIAVITALVLCIGRYHYLPIAGVSPEWRQVIIKLFRGAVILALPLLSVLALRIPLRELGFGWGKPKTWLRDIGLLFVIMLPVVFIVAHQPVFRRVYPYFRIARLGFGYFLISLGIHLVYLFCWEFLFRGYLLFGFKRKVGATAAIAISTIPFVLMHFGKPVPELYGSIIAGIALGIVAVRARSFIPCVILHFAVTSTLDIAAVLIS